MYSTNLMMWNGQFICKYDQIWHANDSINLTDRCLLPTLCGNCHQCMDIHVGQCCKTNVSFISCQMPTSKIARCVPKCKSKSLDLMMRFKLTIANTYTLLCWHFGRLQSTTSFSPKSPQSLELHSPDALRLRLPGSTNYRLLQRSPKVKTRLKTNKRKKRDSTGEEDRTQTS